MTKLFMYRGMHYPSYLRDGNACQFIAATAAHFCKGEGLDIGAGKWPLPGATPIDLVLSSDAYRLPVADRSQDYIFSSHCLEHLDDYVGALKHWREKLRPGGCLFLYLPHPDMEYWRPENCLKHRHMFFPHYVSLLLATLGFEGVIQGERDLAWSFAVVGFNGAPVYE